MKLPQIKKNLLYIFMILAISLPIFGIGYADDGVADVNLFSPRALQVYRPGDTVEISGTAQKLVEVSVAVRNGQNLLIFVAQPSVVNGAFTTSFTLDSDAAEGEYTISLGGLDLTVIEREFVVRSGSEAAVALAKPSEGQEFEAGDVVEITGTAQYMSQVAIFVRNSKKGRVYVAQPPVVDGSFTTKFTLPDDTVAGGYTIEITGSGLAAAQSCHFTVTSTGGGDPGSGGGTVPDPDAILFISGNGVANEISFSRADLEAMTQEKVLYSTTNDMPQDKPVAAEGVPLETLLDQAGMTGARMITLKGSDGYTINFTVDELLNTNRYRFKNGKTETEVKPIIALKRVEGSASFSDMNTTDTPVMCYGQRAQTEQTLLGFVKRLKYITVTTSSPGQWAQPVAKIVTPGSEQKVATQGGEVESGSKIYLETALGTNIYYTTDGSAPDLDSKIFNPHGCGALQGQVDPVIVNKATTVKAMTVGRGKRDSGVLTLSFTVAGATPVTGVTGGGLIAQQAVEEKNILIEELDLENGRKGEKITLQEGALEDIEKGEAGSRLAIASTGDVDEVITEIPAAAVQKARERGMLLGIDSRIGNYTLPLDSLDLDEIAGELGVKPENLNLHIVISKVTEDMKNKLAAQVREGQQMLADPVEFTVEIMSPGGKKIEYKSFGGAYVERELALGGEVDVNHATGALWNEAKGGFLPVPTRFETRDGKYYAVILNRTNSLYTVLQSGKTFSDIEDNWAKEDIELLAAKMLIAGKSETAYEPGSNVTRAEFAALLVRALGLEEGVLKEGQFNDIASTDWYAGSVAAATSENIIAGYEGGLFKPDACITREEMAAMITRAGRVAGKENILADGEQEELLARFKDLEAISSWAATDVALAAKAGIISGMPGGEFSPGSNADRAQSAAILKRFLTYIVSSPPGKNRS